MPISLLRQALLTAEKLRGLLHYDPDTGHFRRFASHAGFDVPAGTITPNGYCVIGVGGIQYPAHRLAWLYIHGEWPADQIDHINGDRGDNRIVNLRQATNWQNCGNSRPKGKRALKGITPFRGRWMAQIKINYRNYYLGLFDTPEEANAAYAKKALEVFGEFGRASA